MKNLSTDLQCRHKAISWPYCVWCACLVFLSCLFADNFILAWPHHLNYMYTGACGLHVVHSVNDFFLNPKCMNSSVINETFN